MVVSWKKKMFIHSWYLNSSEIQNRCSSKKMQHAYFAHQLSLFSSWCSFFVFIIDLFSDFLKNLKIYKLFGGTSYWVIAIPKYRQSPWYSHENNRVWYSFTTLRDGKRFVVYNTIVKMNRPRTPADGN